jgi:hypothetical protein
VVVGVQRLFALRIWAALRHRRNEDGYVQLVRWLAKSVTEKNNRRDGVGSTAKRPCKPRSMRGGDF